MWGEKPGLFLWHLAFFGVSDVSRVPVGGGWGSDEPQESDTSDTVRNRRWLRAGAGARHSPGR